MDVLYALESIRNPFLDQLLGILTYLGDELLVTGVILIVMWCFNKRIGQFLFTIMMFSIVGNQFLKQLCRIPRPWLLDPDFTIVENAREAATGYSFPSGHTASAIGLYGGLAVWTKKRWVQAVLIATVLLVGFTRMYLGVHTPLDVGVSLLIGAVLVVALYLWEKAGDRGTRAYLLLDGFLVLCAIGVVLYAELVFAPTEADPALQANGLKNAWMLLGMCVGLLCIRYADRRWVRFETKGVWWVQILKTAVGLGVVIGVRTIVKEPLYACFGGHYAAEAIRNFLMVLVGGCLWPITFRYWNRLPKVQNKGEK